MGSQSFPKGDHGCVSIVSLSIAMPLSGLPILLGHSGIHLFQDETYSREVHGIHVNTHYCGRSQGLLPILSVWGPLSLSHHLCSLDISLCGMTQTLNAEGSMLLVTLLLPSWVCSTYPCIVTCRQSTQTGPILGHLESTYSPFCHQCGAAAPLPDDQARWWLLS